jgi:hypothetical protein
MSRPVLIAVFEYENDVREAARASRQEGYEIKDAYTPYAVHGLDEAMGLRRSKLSWVTAVAGTLGVAFATWFMFWANGVSWDLNVGGRPWNSLPAYAPIMFEVMVLSAGVSTVIALLWRQRLYPGKTAVLAAYGVTDNRFALVLDASGSAELAVMRQLLDRHGAVEIVERQVEEAD